MNVLVWVLSSLKKMGLDLSKGVDVMVLARGRIGLNSALVKQQGLSQEDVNVILDLHEERIELFEKFEFVDILPTHYIHQMVLELEEIEYLMQSAWGFKQDKDKHTWWNKVPNCTCEQNDTYFQSPRKIEKSCKVHGKILDF